MDLLVPAILAPRSRSFLLLVDLVLFGPSGGLIYRALEILILAGTFAEALIVSARRNIGSEMSALVGGLGFEVVNVTAAAARRIGDVFARWGKGLDPAGLNFGDCELALQPSEGVATGKRLCRMF